MIFLFDPETEILITAGSKVAIQMSFLSILNKGDEVISRAILGKLY